MRDETVECAVCGKELWGWISCRQCDAPMCVGCQRNVHGFAACSEDCSASLEIRLGLDPTCLSCGGSGKQMGQWHERSCSFCTGTGQVEIQAEDDDE